MQVCTNTPLPGAWQKEFEFGPGRSILQCGDGGFAVAGVGLENENVLGRTPYLLKTDVEGRELWSVAFTEGGLFLVHAVAEAPDGSLVVTGNDEFFVRAFCVDAEGNTRWSRIFAENERLAYPHSQLTATSDGNFIVASSGQLNPSSPSNTHIVKFDVDGNTIWTRVLNFADDDLLLGVAPTDDGGVTVLSEEITYLKSDTPKLTPASTTRHRLQRFTSNGVVVWTAMPSLDFYSGASLASTSDGGSAVLGYDKITRFDADGELLWDRLFDSTLGVYAVNGFREASDGGFLFGSTTFEVDESYVTTCQSAALIKLNDSGAVAWEQAYGTGMCELLVDIAATADGGYMLLGSKNPNSVSLYRNMFLLKVDGDS